VSELVNENRKLTFGQQIGVFVKSSSARATFIIAILLLVLTWILKPTMDVQNTLSSVLILTVLLSIASAGQTIVLVGGGMDFTVGAVMSSTAIITTYIMNGQEGHFLEVFVLAMGVGLLVGLLNGIVTTKINLPPMILTMAISNVVTRMQYVFTAGQPGGYASDAFSSTIFYPVFGFIPAIVMYAIIVWPIVFFLLNRSTFGRQLFLVGANPGAARLNGINVNKIKVVSYVLSGVLCAFAGMLGAAYMETARCQIFDKYAFNSLIAVIVGGTAFTGGIGTYAGSIAGSLLMVVLDNALTLMNMSQDTQNVTRGVVMILLLIIYNRQKSVRQ
jgi:ribose transport system permease protein